MNEPDLQKLRVAVAEAEGFKPVVRKKYAGTPNVKGWEHVDKCGNTQFTMIAEMLPDYPADRDAIIGAIVRRFVTVEHKTDFYCALHKLIREHIGGHWIGGAEDMFALATATAEQLCRAYCAAAGIPATP